MVTVTVTVLVDIVKDSSRLFPETRSIVPEQRKLCARSCDMPLSFFIFPLLFGRKEARGMVRRVVKGRRGRVS
jgi:hypothetical protein